MKLGSFTTSHVASLSSVPSFDMILFPIHAAKRHIAVSAPQTFISGFLLSMDGPFVPRQVSTVPAIEQLSTAWEVTNLCIGCMDPSSPTTILVFGSATAGIDLPCALSMMNHWRIHAWINERAVLDHWPVSIVEKIRKVCYLVRIRVAPNAIVMG